MMLWEDYKLQNVKFELQRSASLGFWLRLAEFDDSKSSPDVNFVGDLRSDELVDIESSLVLSDCLRRLSYFFTASPDGFTTSTMLIRFVSHSTVTLICTSASSPAARHCSLRVLVRSSWKLIKSWVSVNFYGAMFLTFSEFCSQKSKFRSLSPMWRSISFLKVQEIIGSVELNFAVIILQKTHFNFASGSLMNMWNTRKPASPSSSSSE